jgi:5-methylcytosine-specific restriction endonuclease McrA
VRVSWARLDDILADHPKWVAVRSEARTRIESRAGSRAAAKDAYLAWFAALVWGSKVNCDSVIPETAAEQIAPTMALTEDEFLDAAPLLVAAGLWHDITKSGRRCECWRDKRPAVKGWIVHDFMNYQVSKQSKQAKATKAANHTWLHNRAPGRRVKAMVIARDGCWCRYCGIEVNAGNDHRSILSRQFDFVDPDIEFDRNPDATAEELARVAEGVVIACGYCNGRKSNRTPDAAGMRLLPPPEQARRTQTRLGPDPIVPSGGSERDGGTGRVGSGLAGSGRDGSGTDLDPGVDPGVDPFDGVSVLAQRLEQDGLLHQSSVITPSPVSGGSS